MKKNKNPLLQVMCVQYKHLIAKTQWWKLKKLTKNL